MAQHHKIWNIDIGSEYREEELDGRRYIVVPMVMILEGVHTGSQGPVYYSMEELAKTPKMWNLKPIVIEHPFRGDTATDLDVYKKQAVGMVMNTHFVDGKLKAEAWIDIDKAQQKCPTLLEHIEHKLPMEVSTGLFSELILEDGVWNGEPYKGRIVNIRADHLAILPSKQGACSLADGAGLLINQRQAPQPGDTLNIISTVINQEYVAGCNVVLDEEDENQEPVKRPELKTHKPVPEKSDKVKKKIEDPLQEQRFVTAEGYEIVIRPPKGKEFKAEEPNTVPLDNVITEDGTPVSSLVENAPEEVPVQDNPTIIEDEDAVYESADGDETKLTELLQQVSEKAMQWLLAHGHTPLPEESKVPSDQGDQPAPEGPQTEDTGPTDDSSDEEAKAQLKQLKRLLMKRFPGAKDFNDLVAWYLEGTKDFTDKEERLLAKALLVVQGLETKLGLNSDNKTAETTEQNADSHLDTSSILQSHLNGATEALCHLRNDYQHRRDGVVHNEDSWHVFPKDVSEREYRALELAYITKIIALKQALGLM